MHGRESTSEFDKFQGLDDSTELLIPELKELTVNIVNM